MRRRCEQLAEMLGTKRNIEVDLKELKPLQAALRQLELDLQPQASP